MPCEKPCTNCKREGLPILFTRYAAAYSAQDKGMAALRKLAPIKPLESKPGGVDIKTAVYGVRMLRTGYLYVRFVNPAYRAPQWWGFAVHPHGYLMQFTVSQPETAQAKVACARDARQANNSLIWVPDAQNVTEFHYLFHPDVIDYQHLMHEIEPKRDQYMQKLDIAAWAKGTTSQTHTCTPDKLATQVPEFAALGNQAVCDALEGQFFGLMGSDPIERGWGDWEEAVEYDEEEDAPGTAGMMGVKVPTGNKLTTVVNHKGPTYDKAHGQRLKQMAEFLQKNKGAVVACADPIGIAQTLSMCLPLMATPYELWMNSAPAKPLTDFPKLTNGWLVSAAGSIDNLLGAMKQGLTQSQNAELKALKDHRKLVSDRNLFVPSRMERQPDGTYRSISPDQARAEVLARLDAKISKQQADIDAGKVADPKNTLTEARKLFDQSKIDAFNKEQLQPQLKALDERLDALSRDLIAWLDAAAMRGVLERYNGKDPDLGGDGERFALHLSVALLNLDSSNTGRRYLGAKNPFTYARDNLVARVVGCNNAAVSSEVYNACQKLNFSAAANTNAGQQRDPAELELKQLDAMIAMVAGWGKVVKSADKMNKLYDKPPTTVSERLKAANDVQSAIKAAAGAGWSSVLFAAATLVAARAGGTEKEKTLLGARALAFAQGFGSDAQRLLLAQRKEQVEKILAKNPKLTTKVGVGGPREWQAEAASLQRKLDKAVESSGTKSIVGKMRVSGLLFIADAFGTLVGGTAKAGIKMDPRTAMETTGQYLTLVGTFRDLRTTMCEEMVFKTVVTEVKGAEIVVAPFAQGTKLDAVAIKQLLKLRQAAGRFTIAGSVVVVGLDVFDGWRAFNDDKSWLGRAYFARAVGAVATITGVGIGMVTIEMATLVARLNMVGIVVTVVATIAIETLKPKLWQDWFRAQPFRTDNDNTDGSWSQWFAKPSPHKSKAQMLSKLDEATDDAKKGS
ncbi:T6SS effector BTH_I2691 family protein [Ralstonia sp. A12]|uniref:T6SS effector BTH_I2691 family protein n=1 Tax=Ralstonia sp. A12 TaxID=1217052 RepID=UPI000694D4BB|nr:T6SS effector BTH_I2691 family protein [Ralstonia sp. A12]